MIVLLYVHRDVMLLVQAQPVAPNKEELHGESSEDEGINEDHFHLLEKIMIHPMGDQIWMLMGYLTLWTLVPQRSLLCLVMIDYV